jgi:hypothetical protein
MTTGLPHGYTPQPVDDPKKDIAKQGQVIKQAEDAIANLQQSRLRASLITAQGGLQGGLTEPVKCSASGSCFRLFFPVNFGVPVAPVLVRVDAKGNLLPGELQKEVDAQTKAIDLAIAQNTQLLTNAKTQMDFDYASLPLPGNGGADLHRDGTTHQQ